MRSPGKRTGTATVDSLQRGFWEGDAASSPGAVFAIDPGSSGGGSRRGLPKENEARRYVRAVLEHYLRLPGTPRRPSRLDRRCARALYQQGVAMDLVRFALTLGAARRTFRQAGPLPPVRTLHYFLPLVQELLGVAPDPSYIRYVERKLFPLAPDRPP
jgi:hypothetical protein